MKSFVHIGEFVKNRREEVKISQSELSNKLGYKNGQFVSNIERGICSIPAEKVKRLAVALNTTHSPIVDAMTKDYRNNLIKIADLI